MSGICDDVDPPINSDSDDVDDTVDRQWDDWEEDERNPVKCLLCPVVLDSVEDALHHCVGMRTFFHDANNNGIHGFDLAATIRDSGLDFYGVIKLVNYIRTVVESNNGDAGSFHLPHDIAGLLEGEKFLQPVIPDDPFLQHDFDTDRWSDEESSTIENERHSRQRHENVNDDMSELRSQMETLRQQMAEMVVNPPENAPAQTRAEEFDENYIDSYSHFSIHEEMLKDTVRTIAYRDSMYNNPDTFKDKVVLDVGCGTGILSMMAARAGAAHVYGVDFSATADKARLIVEENGMSDKVTIIRGKIEEINLPVEAVDIIISEWMGYFLIFESMYSSVLWARDKWLSPVGIVFPDQATVYITALSNGDRMDYWDDVYGFKMSCMKKAIQREASVGIVDPEAIAATTSLVYSMNMQTMRTGDTGFRSPFHLICTKDTEIRAFMSYFDVAFEYKCQNPVYMTTSATSTPTHWKQTVLYLQNTLKVQQGWAIEGTIDVCHDKESPRELLVELSYTAMDKNGQVQQGPHYQSFKM